MRQDVSPLDFLKVGSINCFQSILFVSSQQTFSRLGIVQTLRDLPSALDLSKTFLFRADFRAEGGRNVSQSERKMMLVSFAEPKKRQRS
jgi:hypothetical protein